MIGNDLYQKITDKILADMERGVMPWERDWQSKQRDALPGMPSNALTGKAYRGINILLLWIAAKAAPIDGKASKPEMPEDTTEFIAALGANVKHGLAHHNNPCYIPALDRVEMPFPDEFSSHDSYRRTLYHELIHWTGNTKRCNRDFSGSFGTAKYAREELIAELGAAFVCAEFGIAYDTRHASYIDSWIKCLKDDNKAIMQAASAAQKAVGYIRESVLGKQAVKELEAA